MKHILFYALFFILKIASAQAQSLDQPKNYPADAISSFAERLEPCLLYTSPSPRD